MKIRIPETDLYLGLGLTVEASALSLGAAGGATPHVTFALLRPSGSSHMEPWLRVQTEGLGFETSYPQSWSSELAESPSDMISGVHIRLADVEQDKLCAYLLVRAQQSAALDAQSPAMWLDQSLAMLERSGLVQTGALRRLDEDDDPRAIGVDGWRGGYTGEGRVRGLRFHESSRNIARTRGIAIHPGLLINPS